MSRKAKSSTPAPASPLKGKLRIGAKETEFSPVVPHRKASWTEAQWKNSQSFWEKKSLREFKGKVSATELAEQRFLSSQVHHRAEELGALSKMQTVSRQGRKMPTGKDAPVQPKPEATRHYKDVMHDIGEFLEPGQHVKSKFNDGGPQLIQRWEPQSQDGPKEVTRRVGIDVEPSGHVKSLRPHLNLQTQFDGQVQKANGLEDPHHPIRSFDPFASSSETRTPHPLAGKLTADEKRSFAERYVQSLGIPIKRSD